MHLDGAREVRRREGRRSGRVQILTRSRRARVPPAAQSPVSSMSRRTVAGACPA